MAGTFSQLKFLHGFQVVDPYLTYAVVFGAVGDLGPVGRPGRAGIFAVFSGYHGRRDVFEAGPWFGDIDNVNAR